MMCEYLTYADIDGIFVYIYIYMSVCDNRLMRKAIAFLMKCY